jgi:hypothetical protein
MEQFFRIFSLFSAIQIYKKDGCRGWFPGDEKNFDIPEGIPNFAALNY